MNNGTHLEGGLTSMPGGCNETVNGASGPLDRSVTPAAMP
jgi:hypothetical protein